ncbi:MAG: FHA domain-containing protein [Desulfobacteraceae bacterium]|nr:FHA domain-containing protein [Desulfobacteraceae bacterium]
MKKNPMIVIQLKHIEGPMKGEIHEFTGSEISIGRHPTCDLRLPTELTVVSRKHVLITRTDNRFRLEDKSTNGTFLNGRQISTADLKDGDVIMLAKDGPKFSFLTKTRKDARSEASGSSASHSSESVEKDDPISPSKHPAAENNKPLISFNKLPVVIGTDPECDVVLNHPVITERHAEFYYGENQYWVIDLTGRQMVSVDGRPINLQSVLSPNSVVSLSANGPVFRFLDGGHLAEIEPSGKTDIEDKITKEASDKGTGLLKKIFRDV